MRVKCDLCGETTTVAAYGVIPHSFTYEPAGDGRILKTERTGAGPYERHYCESCIGAARKRSLRYSALLFFMPTEGIGGIYTFKKADRQEMGDLMAGSEYCGRNPLKQHIQWFRLRDDCLTRRQYQRKLEKPSRYSFGPGG